MSTIVEVDAFRVEICEPWEAGRNDPPMQEWLQLRASDHCPECGSRHWGTKNPRGYFLVRVCHDENCIGCRVQFRPSVTPHMIHEIVGALAGSARRFGLGPVM